MGALAVSLGVSGIVVLVVRLLEGDSFFLMGKMARDAAKGMLKERCTRDENGRRVRALPDERNLDEEEEHNPHTMLANLVPTPEDGALLDSGLQLDIFDEEVFDYGSSQVAPGEGEFPPSSQPAGKIFFFG